MQLELAGQLRRSLDSSIIMMRPSSCEVFDMLRLQKGETARAAARSVNHFEGEICADIT